MEVEVLKVAVFESSRTGGIAGTPTPLWGVGNSPLPVKGTKESNASTRPVCPYTSTSLVLRLFAIECGGLAFNHPGTLMVCESRDSFDQNGTGSRRALLTLSGGVRIEVGGHLAEISILVEYKTFLWALKGVQSRPIFTTRPLLGRSSGSRRGALSRLSLSQRGGHGIDDSVHIAPLT